METEILQERADVSGARVDRANAIIRGVKLLGIASRNGREYPLKTLRAAVERYIHRAVNVDHAGGDGRRSYRDRIGTIISAECRPDGLYGNLRINPKHVLSEQLLWDAEHAPENVGLSHDAEGKVVRRGGKMIVEKIESVRSVDLVADPASTAGLFEDHDQAGGESEARRPLTKQEIAEDIEAVREMAAARKADSVPTIPYVGPRGWGGDMPSTCPPAPLMSEEAATAPLRAVVSCWRHGGDRPTGTDDRRPLRERVAAWRE